MKGTRDSSQTPQREWHLEETYKGLLTLGIETLKVFFLLNGGALVTSLAYLGNQSSRIALKHDLHIGRVLFCFWVALVLTAIAFVLAYIMQLVLYGEELKRCDQQPFKRRHQYLLWIAVATGVWLHRRFRYRLLLRDAESVAGNRPVANRGPFSAVRSHKSTENGRWLEQSPEWFPAPLQ
jgi:hypothetical protein